MMSSAISTKELPAEAGSYRKRRGRIDRRPPDADAADDQVPDAGFQIWHFFVLLSLMAATVAVIVSRRSTPEHLVLISLSIGAAGTAAIACYRMLAPLAASESELATEPLSERLRADLEREKALTLRSIKELEFDRAMGKLSQPDFDEMAGRLRARAIGIMKQLDDAGGTYRAEIERELAARVGAEPAPRVSTAPAPARVTNSCSCGVTNDPDARFCKACGRKL